MRKHQIKYYKLSAVKYASRTDNQLANCKRVYSNTYPAGIADTHGPQMCKY